jgi:diguanylate cyclase (GGDEF)-like protein
MTLVTTISLMLDNIRLYERVLEQSIVDPLTEVYNRRHLDNKLTEEFDRAVRYQRELSFLLLDVDDFKKLNDTHGHLQGDRVLAELGFFLKKRSRTIDVVCRYGGEEFALLLPETGGPNAHTKADRFRKEIAQNGFTRLGEGEPLHLTVSLGVSCLTPKVRTPLALIRVADEALYQAKREGKDRAVLGASV